jgi:hypothetical protein
LSLNSDCVMRFRWDGSGSGMASDARRTLPTFFDGENKNSQNKQKVNKDTDTDADVVAFLPKRSVYVLANAFRYFFTHEIPTNDDNSVFKGEKVNRKRRISVILRDFNLNDPVYKAYFGHRTTLINHQ